MLQFGPQAIRHEFNELTRLKCKNLKKWKQNRPNAWLLSFMSLQLIQLCQSHELISAHKRSVDLQFYHANQTVGQGRVNFKEIRI